MLHAFLKRKGTKIDLRWCVHDYWRMHFNADFRGGRMMTRMCVFWGLAKTWFLQQYFCNILVTFSHLVFDFWTSALRNWNHSLLFFVQFIWTLINNFKTGYGAYFLGLQASGMGQGKRTCSTRLLDTLILITW